MAFAAFLTFDHFDTAMAQTYPFTSATNSPSAAAATPGASPTGTGVGQATANPFAPQQPTNPRTVIEDNGDRRDQNDRDRTSRTGTRSNEQEDVRASDERPPRRPLRPAPPSEFETFVEKTLGKPLPRFGEDLVGPEKADFSTPDTTAVTPDYLINPGDEIIIRSTGSLEADLHLTVTNEGQVFVPRVGTIKVAGVRAADLQAVVARRVGEQYRNFKISVAVGQLHGITVYVTGYAVNPGAYTLSSLSTLVNAVMAAGGPSNAGSFRSIALRRNGTTVTTFDLYDLLLNGDKTRDSPLQNQDVIYIAPVGPQTAIAGSVNAEAIYEAKQGETLGDLLHYAGGLSSLADESKSYVSRLSNLDTFGWAQLPLAQARSTPIQRGDVMRIVSVADYARPQERQAIVVKIEGEVGRPGRYYMAPNSTLADLMKEAGGLTPRAFIYGTELDRVSVQQQQQAGFDQAVRNLQMAIAASPLGLGALDQSQVGPQSARAQMALQVLEQMKTRKPDGRMILSLGPDTTALPGELTLENDDRILIPPMPVTVGVFGATYQQGSFVFSSGKTIGDYLKLAGGPQRTAEKNDIFVVRANGAVVSRRQRGFRGHFDKEPVLPGDVIFVPLRTQPNLWWERVLQASQVFYNIGLSAAAIKVLSD